MMSPTLTTFLFEAINFLLLAGILGWLLFKPVRRAIEHERAQRENQIQVAADKQAAADKREQELQSRYASLEKELEKIRTDTRNAAERDARQLREEASAAAQRERDTLRQRLGQMESQELQRLAGVVAETAGAVVRRLLADLNSPELQKILLHGACQQLSLLKGALGEVVIESATPLDAEQKTELESALESRAQQIIYRVRQELGSGLRIRTANGTVDASELSLGLFAQRELSRRLQANTTSQMSAATSENAETRFLQQDLIVTPQSGNNGAGDA